MFNVGKCKVMHFGARKNKFYYTMDGVTLDEVQVEKGVGVLVADNLRPSQQ